MKNELLEARGRLGFFRWVEWKTGVNNLETKAKVWNSKKLAARFFFSFLLLAAFLKKKKIRKKGRVWEIGLKNDPRAFLK